jgi:hypothetical protein
MRGFCDRAGARTQDPLLKREMLYQLSYQVIQSLIASANITPYFKLANFLLQFFRSG